MWNVGGHRFETVRGLKAQTLELMLLGMLSYARVDGEMVHPEGCPGDCEELRPELNEYVAQDVKWELDLAIEAKPVWGNNPKEIFDNLFHVVSKDGQKVAGLTSTEIDLNQMRWSGNLDCESLPNSGGFRTCFVSDGKPLFQWHHLVTGGPDEVAAPLPFAKGIGATTSVYYQGRPVIRPRVKIHVSVGWPAVGVQGLPEHWRKPILEAIYLILGHEKLHVDNFLEHLPQIAHVVLHPDVTSFELYEGEDPWEKLNIVARAAAIKQLNRILFDPDLSDCKRMNCVYDGKGQDCNGGGEHQSSEKHLAASWQAPLEVDSDRWGAVQLQMFIDKGSYYPGPKSPLDFKAPEPFAFRWAKQ